MTPSEENPWTDRFALVANRDKIRELVRVSPQPILGIREMLTHQASVCLEDAFSRMFYPSNQCLDILMEWVAMAWAHSIQMYGSVRAFIEGVHMRNAPLPEFCFPSCLTGPAGSGKSTLMQALQRLITPKRSMVDSGNYEVSLVGYRAITVRSSGTARDILVQFADKEGTTRALSEHVRKVAFRDGWSLVLEDEFQFATQSANASTRVTQMIFAMCYLGIPAVFIANYSLLHKLKRRNQEEQHRLLGKVRVLSPDPWDSEDWKGFLKCIREIAPEIFVFDPEADAEVIHYLTGGIYRFLVKIVEIAFWSEFPTGMVDLPSLERAYKSKDYSVFRDDLKALHKLSGSFRDKRKDLWCPIESDELLPAASDLSRQAAVDASTLDRSLTVDERAAREALNSAKRSVSNSAKKKAARVLKPEMSDGDRLKANMTWFANTPK